MIERLWWWDDDWLHIGPFTFSDERVEDSWHALTKLGGFMADGQSRSRTLARVKSLWNALLHWGSRRLEWT